MSLPFLSWRDESPESDECALLPLVKDPLPYVDALLFFVLNNGYSR